MNERTEPWDANPIGSLNSDSMSNESQQTDTSVFLADEAEPDAELIRLFEMALNGEIALDQIESKDPLRADAIRELLPMVDQLKDPEIEYPHVPFLTLDNYQIVREIAHGGMGCVYEAVDEKFNRRVAVKVLPLTLDRRRIKRFQYEAEAAAHLDHRHIVPVHSSGQSQGVYYYVMKYVEGFDLARLIRVMRHQRSQAQRAAKPAATVAIENRNQEDFDYTVRSETRLLSTLPDSLRSLAQTGDAHSHADYYRAVARIGMQAAEALQHAHEQNVVHRDIKPGNLLLDGDGNLWVTDFGLALLHGEAGATEVNVVGTLRYMSPEQSMPDRVTVDDRTDIYSLGVTLYELITLRQAFSGPKSEILKKIALEEPPAPRKVDRRIPTELQLIVMKAMCKHPDDRYQSAEAMAADLRAFSEGRPIDTEPPALHQRFFRFVRRRQRTVANLAAIVLVMLLATSVSAFVIFQAFAGEREMRQALEKSLRRSDSRRLVAEGRITERYDTAGAALLAKEAMERDENAEARTLLFGAMDQLHEMQTLALQRGPVLTTDVSASGRSVHCFAARSGESKQPAVIVDFASAKQTPIGDVNITKSCVFDPKGARLLSVSRKASGGDVTSLWDASGGNLLWELPESALREAEPQSFSPEGEHVVAPLTGNRAGVFSVFDATEILQIPHEAEVVRAMYTRAGTEIVTLDSQQKIHIWNATDGKPLATIDVTRGAEKVDLVKGVWTAGPLVLVQVGYRHLEVWNWRTTKRVRIGGSETMLASRIAVSANGEILAVSHSKRIRFFHLPSLTAASLTVQHAAPIEQMVLSEAGEWLALLEHGVGDWKQVSVYSVGTGAASALRGHAGKVNAVQFLSGSDGREQLATCSEDSTVRRWHAKPLGVSSFPNIELAAAPFGAVAVDGDKAVVATRGEKRASVLVNGSVKRRLVGRVLPQRSETHLLITNADGVSLTQASNFESVDRIDVPIVGVHHADLSPDSQWFIVLKHIGEPILKRRGMPKATLGVSAAHAAAFHPSSEQLAVAYADGWIVTYRLDGVGVREEHRVDTGAEISRLHFSGDGRHLLSVSHVSETVLWTTDLQTRHTLEPAPGGISDVKFHRGTILGWGRNVVVAWDVDSRRIIATREMSGIENVSLNPVRDEVCIAAKQAVESWSYLEEAKDDQVKTILDSGARQCVYSADGSKVSLVTPATTNVMMANGPTQLHVVDLPSGEGRAFDLANNGDQSLIALDPTSVIVSGTQFGARRIDVESGETLFAVAGHALPLTFAAAYKNGLVTASKDRTAILWSETGEPLRRLSAHKAPIVHACLDSNEPDGPPVLVSTDDHGVTVVWNLENGDVLRTCQGPAGRIVDYDPATDRLLRVDRAEASILIWNSKTGDEHKIELENPPITGALAPTRGGFGISVLKDGEATKPHVLLYQTPDAAPRRLELPKSASELVYDATGTQLLVTTQNQVAAWNAVTGTKQWAAPVAGQARVRFGHGGRYAVAAGMRSMAILDTKSGERWATIPSEIELSLGFFPSGAVGAIMTDEGQFLINVTKRRQLRRWRLWDWRSADFRNQLSRELSEEESKRYLQLDLSPIRDTTHGENPNR